MFGAISKSYSIALMVNFDNSELLYLKIYIEYIYLDQIQGNVIFIGLFALFTGFYIWDPPTDP